VGNPKRHKINPKTQNRVGCPSFRHQINNGTCLDIITESTLFKAHLIALVVVVAFAFLGSLLLLKITDLISPLKVSAEEQEIGSDLAQHGEGLSS
jgi:ammonia channel protein AmtB